MTINRHNCESYFLDYYEKNLSPVEVAEVLFFLEENPDLKEVFEAYEEICLEHERVNFPDKESIKKKYSGEEIAAILNGEVLPETCEQFFIADAEGILTAPQKEKLRLFLLQYPEKKKEAELFLQCRLTAEKIAFDSKSSLKKETITAENREEYFVRAVDGDLTEDEQQALYAFLAAHPEFKKEFDLFSKTILPKDVISFEGKQVLYKSAITLENYEEYFIRSLEKDLSRAEEEQVQAFLQKNPGLKKEFDLFARTILPAETVVFDNKEGLKKRERKPVVVSIFSQRTMYYAAAAAILLLIGLFFIFRNEGTEKQLMAGKPESGTKTIIEVQKEKSQVTSHKPHGESQKSEVRSHESQVTSHKSQGNSRETGIDEKQLNNPSPEPEVKKQDVQLKPVVIEDPSGLIAEKEKEAPVMMEQETLAAKKQEEQKTNEPAITAASVSVSKNKSADDEYQTLGSFVRKKVKSTLGLQNASTCEADDEITMWDLAVVAKNRIQKAIGTNAIDMEKVCEGTGDKVEYVFTAGNFELTRSASK